MSKNLTWFHEAWTDYLFGQREDKKTLKKINRLLKDILREPFDGLGAPEPLKFDLSGYWSRRIDQKNRLVYAVEAEGIFILSCRFHYSDK